MISRRLPPDIRGTDKAKVIDTIRALRPAFEAEGVTHVWLFGSVARGEAVPDSDVDLFFDHNLKKFGLIEYSGLKLFAEDHLPLKVDFIHRGTMHPEIRKCAESRAEQIF